MKRKIKILLIFYLCSLFVASAQYQSKPGEVDIFMGLDLKYRDIYHKRVFDVLLNLTPGVKWNMGREWQVAGQVFIPIVNQYGDLYKNVRINMLNVSKVLTMNNRRGALKITVGIFSQERYGIDVKGMFMLRSWVALAAQAGFTGYVSMQRGWDASYMGRIMALGGADFYINRWDCEIRVRAGRYLYKDTGCGIEGMRHFKHTTVSLFGEYSNIGKLNGGFKVVVMLPPYNMKRRKVNFRPASNFRLTYHKEYAPYSNQVYQTDPEENEYDGWFGRHYLEYDDKSDSN